MNPLLAYCYGHAQVVRTCMVLHNICSKPSKKVWMVCSLFFTGSRSSSSWQHWD